MARRIVTIASAVVLALLGTMLVVVYVGRADARAMEGLATVKVLVATGPLTEGQSVAEAQSEGLIGEQTLPQKVVPADALTTFLPSDGTMVFASDVTPGEILQRPRLVAASEAQPDKLIIPDGKLAVTVQLEDPARVAGLVKVGSEIAVFDSFNAFEGNELGKKRTPSGDGLSDEFNKNKATRVLLPRVQVLAIGEQTSAVAPPAAEAAEESTGAMAGGMPDTTLTLVTVAVDQNEALKLVHGTQTGALYMGLLGTYEVESGAGVDNRTLFDQ